MQLKSRARGRRGWSQLPSYSAFTLVEVLCSIAIAAFVVSALFYGFDNGYAMLRSTREDLRATQILMQRTEVIRLLTWTQLASCPTTFQESYNQTTATNTPNGIIYYGSLSVTTATNIPDTVTYKSGVQLVTVAVVWTNTSGSITIAHRREMQTLSAKNGMQNYLDGGGS